MRMNLSEVWDNNNNNNNDHDHEISGMKSERVLCLGEHLERVLSRRAITGQTILLSGKEIERERERAKC